MIKWSNMRKLRTGLFHQVFAFWIKMIQMQVQFTHIMILKINSIVFFILKLQVTISTLKFLHFKEKSEKYVDTAKLCGSWLMNLYETYGGIVMGVGSESRLTDQIFSF